MGTKKTPGFLTEGNILISRTDSIGDVVLTLPLAGYLKTRFPGTRIIFLGRSYTEPVIKACKYVDEFINRDEFIALDEASKVDRFVMLKADCVVHVFPDKEIARLCKKAGIPFRIGTSHRWYHWMYCNHLPSFSRRRSEKHEAVLNFCLLEPLTGVMYPTDEELFQYTGLSHVQPLPARIKQLLNPARFSLILHPKSKGSSREWDQEKYLALMHLLPAEDFSFFITGTKKDGEQISTLLTQLPVNAADLTGKLNLVDLLALIQASDGIVASSTGPLHLGAALGKVAVGLYPPIKPMHPGRWRPIGPRATTFSAEKNCNRCREGSKCLCMDEIDPTRVAEYLLEACVQKKKNNCAEAFQSPIC